MASLKILSSLGIAKEMSISSPTIQYTPFGSPLKKLKLRKMKVRFKATFSRKALALMQKTGQRVIKIEVSEKMPTVKKGEKVTVYMKSDIASEEITGILYHVRKPYKNSESRIYYIRAESSSVPKAS